MSAMTRARKTLHTRLRACGQYDGQVERLTKGGVLDDIPIEIAGGVVTDDVQKADLMVYDEQGDVVPVDAFKLI